MSLPDSSLPSRRDVLRGLGLAGVGGLAGAAGFGLIPSRATAAASSAPAPRLHVTACTPACVLTPSVTEGPYYFDANQMRRDITEGFAGVPVELVVGLVNVDTCAPISGALIDVWHANAAGIYSGYNQPGANTVGQDFLRGIQATDANGEAAFDTIYPGWYRGRAIHIHFKVRFSSRTYLTSQLFFPEAINTTVCTTRTPYSSRGTPDTTHARDSIYQQTGGTTLMTVTDNGAGGYTATIVIGVTGLATAAEATPDVPKASLGVPFPNPTPSVATLWLTLARPQADVRVALLDLMGREVRRLHAGPLLSGRHPVEVDASDLAPGTYAVRADVGFDVLVQPLTVQR